MSFYQPKYQKIKSPSLFLPFIQMGIHIHPHHIPIPIIKPKKIRSHSICEYMMAIYLIFQFDFKFDFMYGKCFILTISTCTRGVIASRIRIFIVTSDRWLSVNLNGLQSNSLHTCPISPSINEMI